MEKRILIIVGVLLIAAIGCVPAFAQQDSRPQRTALLKMIKEANARQANIKEHEAVGNVIGKVPDNITFKCKVCSKDTVHPRPEAAVRRDLWPLAQLDEYRKTLVEVIKFSEMSFDLDETGFCSNCCKGTPTGKIQLIVVVDDEDVINELQPNDLRILEAFFRKADEVDIQRGTGFKTMPLKNFTPRVRRLLVAK